MTDPIRIDVWSDFVCPWCYMAGLSLQRLGEIHPIEMNWRAFELRPAGSPPPPPEYLRRIEAGRPILAARFRREHDVALDPGPFGIDTRPMHILKKYAEKQGVGNQFYQAALEAYWQRGEDISDETVQRALLNKVGITQAPAEILQDAELQRAVLAEEQFAYENGITGVPAMVFDQKYLVVGAQPLETLEQVVQEVEAKRGTDGDE